MSLYVYEFLYRGRPEGSKEPAAFHVILGDYGKDAFGQATQSLSQAMTPAQAEALGFGLPAIVSAINADLMAENLALRAAQAELASENTALRAAAGDSSSAA